MATMVCRAGSQPCLESQLVEPRTPLWFNYSSPRPTFSRLPLELALKSCFRDFTNVEVSPYLHENQTSKTASPSSVSQSPMEPTPLGKGAETSYIHPLVKRSLSSLSDRSLEICTENLGSETGSDFIESSIVSPMESNGDRNSSSGEKVNSPASPQLPRAKKVNTLHKFPPPLTTMSRSNPLSVRSHRKDGRLIIEAQETTESNNRCFRAERNDGRLRLYLLKSSTKTSRTGTKVAEEPSKPENGGKVEEKENDVGENGNDDAREEGEEEGGAGMGTEKTERACSCWCKEGGNERRGLLTRNWESLLITSS